MPRFFFDVHDGRNLPDTEGTELPDRSRVRGEAIKCAGEMLKDTDGWLLGEEWRMSVKDEHGRLVLSLRFSAIEH